MVFYPIRSDSKAFDPILFDSPEFWLGMKRRECDACWATYVLCVLCVLGAGAGAKRRPAKPVDPAGEVSCAGG